MFEPKVEFDLAPLQPRFWFADHVFTCVTEDGLVLLDTKSDKYLGLGAKALRSIATSVHGIPASEVSAVDARRAQATINKLLSLGLLIEHPPAPRTPCELPPHGNWVSVGPGNHQRSRITFTHLLVFLRSYLTARWMLHVLSFQARIQLLKSRKNSSAKILKSSRELVDLVLIFRDLRPFFFSSEGRCLLRALTLLNFLSHYDHYPSWVIGVQTRPWAAHTWVQAEEMVLDGTPEEVLYYTPILVL